MTAASDKAARVCPVARRRRRAADRAAFAALVDGASIPLGLKARDGDQVSVRGRVGLIEVAATVTDRIQPGHVFTTFHFPETRTNLLIVQSADTNTSCPEYKVIAVDVRPLGEVPSMLPALA